MIHIRATGQKAGRPAEAIVHMIDYYDDETGFRAMERTTGWDAAIVAAMKYSIDNGYRYLVNMDADFSHPPKYLPALVDGMDPPAGPPPLAHQAKAP